MTTTYNVSSEGAAFGNTDTTTLNGAIRTIDLGPAAGHLDKPLPCVGSDRNDNFETRGILESLGVLNRAGEGWTNPATMRHRVSPKKTP
jgi:hypothetical protein